MTEEEDGDGEKHIAYKDYRGLIREFPQIAPWAIEGNDDPIPAKKIPGIPAHKITSGTFDITRIPSPVQSKINFLEARVAKLEKRK